MGVGNVAAHADRVLEGQRGGGVGGPFVHGVVIVSADAEPAVTGAVPAGVKRLALGVVLHGQGESVGGDPVGLEDRSVVIFDLAKMNLNFSGEAT